MWIYFVKELPRLFYNIVDLKRISICTVLPLKSIAMRIEFFTRPSTAVEDFDISFLFVHWIYGKRLTMYIFLPSLLCML